MWTKRITVIVSCLAIAFSSWVIGGHFLSDNSEVVQNQQFPKYMGMNLDSFDPEKFTPSPAAGFDIPEIVAIPVKTANEIEQEVRDDELVLGVEVAGQYRAYPINQMTGPAREIFNDVLGDTPIAATW